MEAVSAFSRWHRCACHNTEYKLTHESILVPLYFSLVDGRYRVPIRSVLLTWVLCALLALLNIGSGTYIALGAIVSLSSLASYFSYSIILCVTLHTRLTTGLQTSEWSMGRSGLYVNAFALVYTLYAMIWLPFPTTLPVGASNMNYWPVFGAVMIGALVAWFVWGRRHWPGPNKDIVEIVLRLASSV
jgi:amino acid transporter